MSALTGWLGRKARNRAEKQRVRARAKAIGQARTTVAAQFDLWETSISKRSSMEPGSRQRVPCGRSSRGPR